MEDGGGGLDPPAPATVGLLLPPPFKQRRQWHTRSHPLANPLSPVRPSTSARGAPSKSQPNPGVVYPQPDPTALHPLPPLLRADRVQEALFPTDRGRWCGSSFPDATEAAPCLASHGLDHSSGGPSPFPMRPLLPRRAYGRGEGDLRRGGSSTKEKHQSC
jgi:hypothetical protein